MLLILPILTLIVYIYTLIRLLKNKSEHTNMYIFLITTPLVVSIIDAAIIYHFHSLNISNPLVFALVIFFALMASIFKGISFIKDGDDGLKKSPLYDLLSIISLVLVLVFFR